MHAAIAGVVLGVSSTLLLQSLLSVWKKKQRDYIEEVVADELKFYHKNYTREYRSDVMAKYYELRRDVVELSKRVAKADSEDK